MVRFFLARHLHCSENPIYVFLFWEQRGLSPNFHIHVSVSDLYRPRSGLHTVFPPACRTGRPIVGIYKSLRDARMWKLGLRHRYFYSGNICFEISVIYLCSVGLNPGKLRLLYWQSDALITRLHLIYCPFALPWLFPRIHVAASLLILATAPPSDSSCSHHAGISFPADPLVLAIPPPIQV